MAIDFSCDEAELKENPDELIKLIKELYIKVQQLEKENKQVGLLAKEVARLQTELAKYTSPHIPSSKQLYHKKGKQSGIPKQLRGKRGSSKKGRSGVT